MFLDFVECVRQVFPHGHAADAFDGLRLSLQSDTIVVEEETTDEE